MTRRVLVLGTGSIGLRHARLLAERSDVAVEVCDSRPEGLAEAAQVVPDARAWSGFEPALESRPDVVLIATPPSSHASLARAALEAGAHVFCEKPMSDTAAGGREIVAARDRTKRLVNIGFVQRFAPELERIRQRIQAGDIGRVCYARFSVGSLATLEFSRSRHQRAVFGAAALDYVYGFDTFWWVLREQPRGIYARGAQVDGLPLTSNPNVIGAVADYDSPLVAELHIDYVAKPERGAYFFQGDLGHLRFDMMRHTVEHGDRESGRVTEENFAYERDSIMRTQRDHFLEAVEGHHDVHTTPDDALPGTAAAETMIRSLASGRRETLPVSRSREPA
jgi:myo-inositol 2-dehydrogenase/D-chiro-inositol 1-dehydrogenase/scyllo-inositol 2-dehydrogenase (NAD+)